MTSDLLAAVRTVLAAAFRDNRDDYDDACTATVYAFQTAGDAETTGEGFVSVIAALAIDIGEAAAASRPGLSAVLLRILETVATNRTREQLIETEMASLEIEMVDLTD